jgi:hypothetical protein
MGLLDDLKRQADALKQTQAEDQQRVSENAEAIEAALSKCFKYLDDAAKQLQVLQPRSSRAFALEGVGTFDSLTMTEFFVDFRKKTRGGSEHFDYVLFRYKYVGEGTIVTKKDTPQSVERCNDLLWRFNLKYESDPIRNERGHTVASIYRIPRVIVANVRIEGNDMSGRITFELKNVERFDAMKFAFDASEVNDALLEELTKVFLGQPSQFRAKGELVL